jgi:O-succinylbenzoic acid--CoA ligase
MFNTYREFEASVEGMCAQLKTFPHDKVAFWAAASPESVYLFFACWKLGKIACPLNTRLPSCEKELARLETELFIPQQPQQLPPVPWEWNENNLATMVFTSGTTGTPKIACHTIAHHLYNAKGSAIPLCSQDRWLLSLPLFHVGGIAILFRCYLAQAQIALPSQNYDGITHLSLVPTQLKRLLENKAPLPHVKYIMLGGAPLPNFSAPWNVVPTYGMTEMSSQIASAGIVHPYAELKIADDGEILVKGKTLFKGYYTHGRIELPVDEEGWFATKDLGRFNTEGKLEIIGRKDNLFISGGENIQPEEIEAELQKLPGIFQAIVVPIPDSEFGARPVVFLDPPLSLNEIEKALATILPKYKIPIGAFPLPETDRFKHNRRKLSEIAIRCRQTQE